MKITTDIIERAMAVRNTEPANAEDCDGNFCPIQRLEIRWSKLNQQWGERAYCGCNRRSKFQRFWLTKKICVLNALVFAEDQMHLYDRPMPSIYVFTKKGNLTKILPYFI